MCICSLIGNFHWNKIIGNLLLNQFPIEFLLDSKALPTDKALLALLQD
jgi:hypothetical protein